MAPDAAAGDGPHDLEPRAHGALRVVVVRLRVAEVHEHAVSEELGDVPFVAADDLRAEKLKVLQEVAEVLGIEPPRERRRVDDVAEDDVHLPSLREGLRGFHDEARPARQAELRDVRVRRTAIFADHYFGSLSSNHSCFGLHQKYFPGRVSGSFRLWRSREMAGEARRNED